MIDKYQESLDYLNKPLNWKNNANEIGKHILVLQELIDNHSKFNEDKGCQTICDTKALLEEELSILKERNELLEKALDKACEVLSEQEFIDIISTEMMGKLIYPATKENWKMSLLKESEK